MNVSELQSLGLSMAESKLYLILVRLGASDVSTLIRETGFYKANTYAALERLCEKGIISKIVEGKKRIYHLQNPQALLDFVKRKKLDVDFQEELANKIFKEVSKSKQLISSSETATVFRGYAGVRQIYSEIIEKSLDYVVFGSPSASDNIGQYYWQNLHAKQKEKGIKAKMIFNSSLKEWSKIIPKEIISLQFTDDTLEPLTETTIYGTKVAFVVWSEKPVVTIIDNEHVAKSYLQIFKQLWSLAKK